MLVITAMYFTKIAAFLNFSRVLTNTFDWPRKQKDKNLSARVIQQCILLECRPGATQKYLLRFNIHSSQQAVL